MDVRVKNLVGNRYGRLFVVSYAGTRNKAAQWLCYCDCGTEKVISATVVKTQVSCGCYRREKMTTHGLTKTREYHAWCAMKVRCRPDHEGSRYYHKKGITVCVEWENNFKKFLEDMGDCPEGGTLERLRNGEGYSLSNCVWKTQKEQCNNRDSNRRITYNGLTLNLREWAKRTGIKEGTIAARIKAGWPVYLALDSTIFGWQARRRAKAALEMTDAD